MPASESRYLIFADYFFFLSAFAGELVYVPANRCKSLTPFGQQRNCSGRHHQRNCGRRSSEAEFQPGFRTLWSRQLHISTLGPSASTLHGRVKRMLGSERGKWRKSSSSSKKTFIFSMNCIKFQFFLNTYMIFTVAFLQVSRNTQPMARCAKLKV